MEQVILCIAPFWGEFLTQYAVEAVEVVICIVVQSQLIIHLHIGTNNSVVNTHALK